MNSKLVLMIVSSLLLTSLIYPLTQERRQTDIDFDPNNIFDSRTTYNVNNSSTQAQIQAIINSAGVNDIIHFDNGVYIADPPEEEWMEPEPYSIVSKTITIEGEGANTKMQVSFVLSSSTVTFNDINMSTSSINGGDTSTLKSDGGLDVDFLQNLAINVTGMIVHHDISSCTTLKIHYSTLTTIGNPSSTVQIDNSSFYQFTSGGTSILFDNCTVGVAGGSAYISCNQATTSVIKNTHIYNTNSGQYSGGIVFSTFTGSSTVSIYNTEIVAPNGLGLRFYPSYHGELYANNLTINSASYGLELSYVSSSGSSVELEDCTINSNSASIHKTTVVAQSLTATGCSFNNSVIWNNGAITIEDSEFGPNGYGVYCTGTSDINIDGCSFSTVNDGIYKTGTGDLEVTDSSIHSDSEAIYITGATPSLVLNHLSLSCTYGIYSTQALTFDMDNSSFDCSIAGVYSTMSIYGNFTDCSFMGPYGVYSLDGSVAATFENCDFNCDIGVRGDTDTDGDIVFQDCTFSNKSVASETEVTVYGPSGMAPTFVYEEAGSIINYITTVSVTSAPGYRVYLNSSATVVYATGIANSYGQTIFYNVPYIYTNTTATQYQISADLPSTWNADNITVWDYDLSVNVTYYINIHAGPSDKEVKFWSSSARFLISEYVSPAQSQLIDSTTNGSVLNSNVTPNMVVHSETDIIITNNGPTLTFHSFVFTIYNWTGPMSNIDMREYNLTITLDSTVIGVFHTTNGTVIWNGSLGYQSSYYFSFDFPVGTWVLQGNYSAVWVLRATNGPEAIATDILNLIVDGSVVSFDYSTGVYRDRIKYFSALSPTTNVNSVNRLEVTAIQTAQDLDGIILVFHDLVSGVNTIPAANNIKVTYLGLPSQILTTDSNGRVRFEFPLAFDWTPVMVKNFEFQIINVDCPAGTYIGDIDMQVYTDEIGGIIYSPEKTTSESIVVDTTATDHVTTTLYYVYDPLVSHTDPENLAIGLTFGQVAPGDAGVISETWVVIKVLTGSSSVDYIDFDFSDMTYQDGIIPVVGNARIIDVFGYTYINSVPTEVDLSTPIQAGGYYAFRVEIIQIPLSIVSGPYTGTFTATSVHIAASRAPSLFDAFDTVEGVIGVPTDMDYSVLLQMTDNTRTIFFGSPLAVGMEAENQMLIRNGGTLPINTLIFQFSSNDVPATFFMMNGTGAIFYPDSTGRIKIDYPSGFQIDKLQAFRFFVNSIGEDYNSSQNYQGIGYDVTAWRGILTEPPQILSLGQIGLFINGSMAQKDIRAGLNFWCVPTIGNLRYASDLIEIGGIGYVAKWDGTSDQFVYYYFDGRGIDFELTVGMGLIVFGTRPGTIQVSGTVTDHVEYTVMSGLSLVGNTATKSVLASEFISGSPYVRYVAMYLNNEYSYYFADQPTKNNFVISEFQAVWTWAAINETVRYDA